MASVIVDATATHVKISNMLLVMFAIIYVLGFYAYDYDIYLKH